MSAAGKRIWHKGPPPHVGWWNASRKRAIDLWRWWDGEQWSQGARARRTASAAAPIAKRPAWSPKNEIEWSDYYPADARVPRLDPAEGWVLNKGEMPSAIAKAARTEVVYCDGQRGVTDYRTPVFWRKDGNSLDIYAWRPAP